MQVFLTGGTGFVGSYVLRELSARGHRVRALVRSRNKLDGLEEYIDRVVWGDLDNEAALAEGVAGADAVIHVAGLLAASKAKAFYRVNAEGTQKVLRAASRVAQGLERFVYISSIAAAGPSAPGEPLREDEPTNPVSDYGRSKLAGEERAWGYQDRFGITVIRPPVVYGPADTETLVYFKMVQQGRVWSLSDPTMQLSLVFVTDLANGIVDAMENPRAANQTFYLCGDGRPQLREVIQAIEDALHQRAPVTQLPKVVALAAALGVETWGRLTNAPKLVSRDKLKELLATGWICSNRKAKETLGWTPQVDFREGIRQAAEWYIERGWLGR